MVSHRVEFCFLTLKISSYMQKFTPQTAIVPLESLLNSSGSAWPSANLQSCLCVVQLILPDNSGIKVAEVEALGITDKAPAKVSVENILY